MCVQVYIYYNLNSAQENSSRMLLAANKPSHYAPIVILNGRNVILSIRCVCSLTYYKAE
jgi:hypothetical protein